MTQRIEFEGVIHEFPDDFTDADIQNALGGASAPAAPPPLAIEGNPMVAEQPVAAPPRPADVAYEAMSPWDKIKSDVHSNSQAALRGAADFAGAPIDLPVGLFSLANWGVNKISDLFGGPQGAPTSDIPIVGDLYEYPASQRIADFFSDVATRVGAPPMAEEDRTSWQNTTAKPVQYGTGAVMSGGALASRVPGLKTRMAQPNPQYKPLDFLSRQYAQNPTKTIIGDAGAGVGAGVGSDIADDVAPDQPWANLLAMLLGGTGGAALTTTAKGFMDSLAAVPKMGGDVNLPPNPETLAPYKKAAVDKAAEDMQAAATDLPTARANVSANAAELANPTAPGAIPVRPEQMPTSGLLSQDPGLVSMENKSRVMPDAGAKFVQRDENVKEAAAERVAGLKDPNFNPDDVTTGVQGIKKDLTDARDAEAFPLLQQAEAAGVKVDVQPVVDMIDAKLKTTKRDPVVSALSSVRKKLNTPGTEELDTSVSGLYETRKAINDIIEGRGEKATDRFAKRELIEIRDTLDEAITSASPEFGEYLKKYREGSEPLDTFKEGPVAALAADDPRNVVKKILNSDYGADKQILEIENVVKANPKTRDGVKAAVAEVLYDKVKGTKQVGETTEVMRARLAKEFQKNEDVLAKVFTPEEMNTLRQAHKLLDYFKEAEKRATVGSQTAPNLLNTILGKSFQIATRHLYGNLEAGGMIRNVRLMMEMLPNNRQSVQELMEMAWFDPGVAAYLLNKPLKNKGGAPYNVNLKRAFAALETSRQMGEKDEENPE